MPDGKTLKENIQEEKRKFSTMDNKQRWSYFKTYYMPATVILLLVLIAGVWLVAEVAMSARDVEASGLFINVEADENDYYFLKEGYAEYLDLNTMKSNVELSVGTYIGFTPETNTTESQQNQMALFAQVSAGFYSYMILDELALDGLRYMDVYIDPQKLFTEETKGILSDAVVYRDMPVFDGEEGETENRPVALDLSEVGFLQPEGANAGRAYLVFVDVDADYEEMQKFLSYLCTHPAVLEKHAD